MGWVVARITLALVIAGVLGYRWHEGLLTWPLILMSAFIGGLLLVEIFTADRRREQRNLYADGPPGPRRRATDYRPAEIAPEDRVRSSLGGR